ncbi:MAG: SRPBCC family protein, partial [Chloroflexota bacterium]
VFDAIIHPERWPNWWDNIERVEPLAPGDPTTGLGHTRRFTFKTQLPYKLQFNLRVTRLEPPTLIEGQASGELDGIGRWTFTREEGLTRVAYLWQVRTTKWWMNLFAPIARPLFAYNHEAVMRRGGASLAKLLNARLVSEEY